MRIFIILWAFFHFLSLNIYSIELLINPQKPINPKAGYILNLKKKMKIADDGEEFYFRYIIDVKISSDSSIFLLDQRELLKFESDGKFVANFYKHGQGPGEATYVSNFLIKDNRLIVFDGSQSRVLIFDHETQKLKKEFKLDFIGYYEFIEANDDVMFFLHRVIPDTRGKVEVFNLEMKFLSIPFKGHQPRELRTFPMKYIALRAGEKSFSDSRAKFLSCSAGKNLLFISYKPEYEIIVYDYELNRIINRFKRKYKRILTTTETKKYAPGGNIGKFSIDGKQFFDVPVDKYLLDIQQLLYFNNKLWVITSTVFKGNLILVDVFDKEGRYLDNFYLKCPDNSNPYRASSWIKAVKDSYLYTAEQDDDGKLFLKKYEIIK